MALVGNFTWEWTATFTYNDRTIVYGLEGAQADADGDSMDDDWDGDGFCNLHESIAGSNPTNSASRLALMSITAAADDVISWQSVTGRVYALWSSTNLTSGFGLLQALISAMPPLNTLTTTLQATSCRFYRITVDEE